MLVFLRVVHILADVTSLSVTPSSAGPDVLEDSCMPDRDRIDTAEEHTLFISALQEFFHCIMNFYEIFMCILYMLVYIHIVISLAYSHVILSEAKNPCADRDSSLRSE